MTVSVVSTAAPSSSRRAVVLAAKGRNSRARTGEYNRSSSRRRRADGDDDDDASTAIERLESSARSSRSSAYDAKKLAKVRARARTEAREAEAARAAFDTKYADARAGTSREVVTDRMLKRVGVFATPLIFGFATGPAFYDAKAVTGNRCAVVGVFYGVDGDVRRGGRRHIVRRAERELGSETRGIVLGIRGV